MLPYVFSFQKTHKCLTCFYLRLRPLFYPPGLERKCQQRHLSRATSKSANPSQDSRVGGGFSPPIQKKYDRQIGSIFSPENVENF